MSLIFVENQHWKDLISGQSCILGLDQIHVFLSGQLPVVMSLRRLQESSEERLVDVNSLWNVDIRVLQYV